MDEAMKTYNGYVEQEDCFYKRLETLEHCQSAIFDHIFRYGEQFEKLSVEEVLDALHQSEVQLRLQLLQLRLTKAFLAYEMNATS
ncbi:hypothetical protein [Paenibacillus sp. KS-LC4]|uniref:hypothetical protein n=1 Tax=Paenibacillus sp. KS-LC4 TaxID=2979727 RepID=UPI0030CC1F6A